MSGVEEKHYKGKDIECITLRRKDDIKCIIFKPARIEHVKEPEYIRKLIQGCEQVDRISIENLDRYKDVKTQTLFRGFDHFKAIDIRRLYTSPTERMRFEIINYLSNDIEKKAAEHVLTNNDLLIGKLSETINYNKLGKVKGRVFKMGNVEVSIRNFKDKTTYRISYGNFYKYRKDEILTLLKSKLATVFGEFEFMKVAELDKDIDTIREGLLKITQ